MKHFKHLRPIIMVIVFTLFLISCNNGTDEIKDATFKKIIPLAEMNTQAQFWEPSQKFEAGGDIDLTLQNISNEEILFESEPLIFIFRDNQWLPIEDKIQFPQPRGEIVVPPRSENELGVLSIVSWPKLEVGKVATIRVVVLGKIIKNGKPTDKQVGAYIDIRMQP